VKWNTLERILNHQETAIFLPGEWGYETLKVRTYSLSERYRKKKEYIPTKDEVYRMADAARRAGHAYKRSDGMEAGAGCT
jgi:hypothetical protein